MSISINADSPEQMEKYMEEFSKVNCSEVIESTEKQCKNRCAAASSGKKGKRDKYAMKECLSSCNGMLGDFAKNCQTLQKNIKEFKNKSRKEQEKILRDAAEEDRQHRH